MATCRQSPYLHKPATVTVTSFSLWRLVPTALAARSHYDVILIVTLATELATPTVTDVRTDTLPRLIYKDLPGSPMCTPHLIHGSLGPPECKYQTASGLVQRFLHISRLWQADRPRCSIYNIRLHLCSTAMLLYQLFENNSSYMRRRRTSKLVYKFTSRHKRTHSQCLNVFQQSFQSCADTWLCGTAVERWSFAGELSLSSTRPIADGWPLMWVSHPLYRSTNQATQPFIPLGSINEQ